MRENEMIQTLKQEVEIPEIVQHKADEAFIKIKTEATQKKNSRFTQRTRHSLISRSGIAVALVAILAASTFTAGAAAHSIWSNALLTDMDISEEQKSTLEQSDMVDIVNQTATDAGVTITVEQTIADENFAYIAFKIEGYDLPDGVAPAIEETKITVGGHMVDYFGYFYDGIVWDENGSPIMADGSEVQYDETGALVGQYAAEDGSLEYICIINARYLSDYFNPSIIGKTIYAEFQNLGTCISNAEDASYDSTIEAAGHWNLSWTLQGTTDIYHYEFEEELGNSGITLVSADITPISIKTAYSYSTPRDPSKNQPYIALKMQDGTIISPNGPGNIGTMFPYNNIYADRTAFNQIIDPAEISALLVFVPDGIENGMQQYQRYEIPVKDNDNTQ